MLNKIGLMLFALGGFSIAFAQNNYAVKLIPEALLTNANMVKRMEEIKLQINDLGSASETHKYAVTILNAGGEEAANIVEAYDKLISISSFDGKLFDANGKKIRSLKNSDIKDVSGTGENTLADDSRVKMHNFNYTIYPYTIEYEIAFSFKGILSLPVWLPVENEKYSVEQSRLIVECPLDYKLRFKTFNYTAAPTVTAEKKSIRYEWSVQNLPAIEREAYQPEWHEITTAVFLAPTNFEFQNYTGNMSDWKGFGQFIYTLNIGRDKLPENIRLQVHALTDKVISPVEKIKILYEFLQKNTHYISVQLGIGGWQTFDAVYVATKGYGDCKALSNYMFALLKEAGIKSYYTLIKAGENNDGLQTEFPSNQFNHIIVCVPQLKDTIWLECTSQTMPMGYLGGFTCDRNALIIDEDGGRIVHTPIYKKADNAQIRKIIGTVNEEGKLTAVINTIYKARQQDDLHGMLEAVSKERVTEILKSRLNIPSYEVVKFNYTEDKSLLPVLNENLEITANNYVTISGKRLFISPNILNHSYTKISVAAKRVFDINLPAAFTEIDSVEINIPPGYKPESIPADIQIINKFGSYSSAYKISGGKIFYTRNYQRNRERYLPAAAISMDEFFEKIYFADRAKLVFVKEETR